MQYTVELFKKDGRTKAGEKLVEKLDMKEGISKETISDRISKKFPETKGYRFEIFETYVTKKNLLNGQEFQERYDTPYYCSPSSETYWSM
jgi:hypothetical protein